MANILSRIKFEHIVIAGLLIYLFIPKGGKHIQDKTGEIQALERIIQVTNEKLEIIMEWKDAEILSNLHKDSLLAVSFVNNQKTYKPIYENLKNIGSRVDAISGNDDSLRAAGKKRYD